MNEEMKEKDDFLQYFEAERHKTPMHLEIYCSSVMDWCIKIYKKRMNNVFSDVKIYEDEVVICDIQNADLDEGLREAREKLEKWLSEQRAIAESRVNKYKILRREDIVGNNIAYTNAFPVQYEDDPVESQYEMFIQSTQPNKEIYRVYIGDILKKTEVQYSSEEPTDEDPDNCHCAIVIVDTDSKLFFVGSAYSPNLGDAVDRANKIRLELIGAAVTAGLEIQESIRRKRK